MFIAVALVGVVVGFAASQFLQRSPNLPAQLRPSTPPVTAPAPRTNTAPPAQPTVPAQPARPAAPPQSGAASNADPAQAAAIKQAIQSIDDAQAKAVSSKDLSGLGNGATNEFAQQQKSVTQDLIDNGVNEIKLVNIEWGPITVNGATATATAYETWQTTSADGSVDQSRDRNEYTLVQEDGTWKVQSDEHPEAAPGLPDIFRDVPGLPNNILPPGFENPFQNPAPRGPGVQA